MNNIEQENKRIHYLDYLKIFALFAVIVIHVTTPFNHVQALNMDMNYFFRWDRFAVPMFLMVSGCLLLNREYNSSAGSFFLKRSSKLILPYLFWALLIFIAILLSMNPADINIPIEIYQLINYTPLWYFWLILGVYLFIPIVNDFILKRKLDGAKYILIVCIFTSIFYKLCLIFNIHTFLDLRFFAGPILYIVLGYYLRYVDLKISSKKIILICLVAFVVSTFIKMRLFGIPDGIVDFKALPSKFLTSYLDINIFQIIQASSVFLIFRYLEDCKGIIKRLLFNKSILKIVTSMGKATWGIYLIQAFFLEILRPLFHTAVTGTVASVSILAISAVLFIISWVVIVVLHRIPILNKISGYT